MTLRDVAIRFEVGARTLFRVTLRLQVQGFGLDALLNGAPVVLPPLTAGSDGYFLRSMPVERLSEVSTTSDKLLTYVRQRYPRFYTPLVGGYEAYLASFSSKTRSALKRKVRKFEELSGGAIDIREYRAPDEISDFHRLARQVSAKTYQEKLMDAGLPESPQYLEEMRAAAAEGRARGYLLFLENRPVSYLYTPVENGISIYAYLGYDPGLKEHSPGTVLQLEAMARQFAEDPLKLFDFTEGDGQHKRQFGTAHVDCADVLLLRPTLANRLLVAAHSGFDRAIEAAGQTAERLGLKSRLRALVRGG